MQQTAISLRKTCFTLFLLMSTVWCRIPSFKTEKAVRIISLHGNECLDVNNHEESLVRSPCVDGNEQAPNQVGVCT